MYLGINTGALYSRRQIALRDVKELLLIHILEVLVLPLHFEIFAKMLQKTMFFSLSDTNELSCELENIYFQNKSDSGGTYLNVYDLDNVAQTFILNNNILINTLLTYFSYFIYRKKNKNKYKYFTKYIRNS